jgi:mannosyl-3-phosphoglycerate phosphatase
LVETLEQVCRERGYRIRAFCRMSVPEIAAATGLPLHLARLAARREYDDPFEILGPDDHRLFLKAIEQRGLHWTVGGRFYHVTGGNDKAFAVRWLTEIYRKAFGSVTTVGLGDAPNDIGFLNAVDTPIVVRSAYGPLVHAAVPGSYITAGRGAAGWNEAVLQLLAV